VRRLLADAVDELPMTLLRKVNVTYHTVQRLAEEHAAWGLQVSPSDQALVSEAWRALLLSVAWYWLRIKVRSAPLCCR
jgi:hypothetical protein